ncbi:glycosyltransferase [Hyalangium sp.]|uniref:glycosyltransferase n=1 Tax=Hyalangium sp. TaxID=2028555 RepID=UPI002D6921C7|nr:glycosyltransferase [Hyalangium sp.]HYI01259.1 glycosyltransferase [Hyalangium sp.]
MWQGSSVVLTVLAAVLGLGVTAVVLLGVFFYWLYRVDTGARQSTSRPWSEYEATIPQGKKLTFALFYWGSRGDFQPLAVLAQHLKRAGHSVIINVRELNLQAALSLGLREGELFLQEDDHTEDVLTPQLQGQQGPKMLYYLYRHITHHSPSYLKQLNAMLERSKADVLIVNEFAANLGCQAAEKHRLPMFIFRYTPLFMATTSWLCPLFGKSDRGSFINWLSYTLPFFIRLYLERPVMRQLRELHGLKPRSMLSYAFGRTHWQFPSLQGFSSLLMPVPEKDMPRWYFNPGPLLPPAQEETEAVPPALSTFLQENPAGQPVIYIGFGSFSLKQFLPRHQAEQAARDMLEAVQDLGIRAVLLKHTFEFMIDDPLLKNPQWYIGERFPHSWLFPRVSAIVHQAGAGHCAASARSGTPTIAIPIFEEQDFNASALVSAGVAVKLRIQDLSRESFRKAFEEALRLAGQARTVGEQLEGQVQHSGSIAVSGIMKWLGEEQGGSGGASGPYAHTRS